ncbi:MAG: hypothetical protein ACLGHN_13415 [Bacteriovoracia bacterium]
MSKETLEKIYRTIAYWYQRTGLDSLFAETVLLILLALAISIQFNTSPGVNRNPAAPVIYDNLNR